MNSADSADLAILDEHIRRLRITAMDLKTAGASIPAVEKNAVRILAAVKMLELSISDIARMDRSAPADPDAPPTP
jgi:hypothetical protein